MSDSITQQTEQSHPIDLTEWAKQYQQQYIEAIDDCLFNTVIQYSNNARNNQDGGW